MTQAPSESESVLELEGSTPVPAPEGSAPAAPGGSAPPPEGSAPLPPPRPERPGLRSTNHAPVLVKRPPPVPVRLSQLLWALSFVAGAIAVVLLVVIREDQLPLIAEAVRSVDGSRSDETYTSAAEIVFWGAFALTVTLLLVQVTLLVSFMGRRPGIRWWQFTTLVLQVLVYLLVLELVARGEHGPGLSQLLVSQVGLVAGALLLSTLPAALRWTAQRHDIRRGPAGSEFQG